MVTPLPGATLMFAIGLTLLICTSQKAANAVKQLRRKVGFIDKGMAWMEMKMGPKVGDALKRTNPNFPPKPD